MLENQGAQFREMVLNVFSDWAQLAGDLGHITWFPA